MCKILLVDDDVHLTRITSIRLEHAGFEVVVSNRSYGVLNLIAANQPDVVLMDLNMPGLKGPELLELLRQDSELRDTRVVFYSGVAEQELEAQTRIAGANGFAHKMGDFDHLVRTLRAA